MDDPDIAWPYWKFGMKQDHLYTTLADQYNTFSFTIQDPEAFHHDVYEVSNDAATVDEFHSLMAARRTQRLHELNETLETLAVEIISNPKLMATDQWQHAIQLFRTKSYDSIVRFFASYLPDDYLSAHDSYSTSSTFSETDSVKTTSTNTSSVDDGQDIMFLEQPYCCDEEVLTEEPCSFEAIAKSKYIPAVDGPLSPPESEGPHSDLPESQHDELDDLRYDDQPRSRSVSFSGSESGRFCPSIARSSVLADEDDETSQSDAETASTSPSDLMDSHSSVGSLNENMEKHDLGLVDASDDESDFSTAQLPEDEFDTFDSCDTLDSDTPTPRQEPPASSYIEQKTLATRSGYVEYKSLAARRLPSSRRSPSPSPTSLSSSRTIHPLGGPDAIHGTRRSPEEALSKIQKPSRTRSRRGMA
jgi:hypothetical protein